MKLTSLFIALLLGLVSSLRATTIVFDGSNFANRQTAFDTAEVDVIFQSDVFLWGAGYNDLTNAVYTYLGAPLVVDFVALTSEAVTLEQFDLGNYLGAGAPTSYSVYSLSDLVTPLYSSGVFSVTYSVSSHPTYSVGLTDASGLRLILGPDLYNVGLQNIVFSSGTAVNTPDTGSSLALFVLAIAGLGVVRRKVLSRA